MSLTNFLKTMDLLIGLCKNGVSSVAPLLVINNFGIGRDRALTPLCVIRKQRQLLFDSGKGRTVHEFLERTIRQNLLER